MFGYLIATNSFKDFYEQAFLFNTKVYYHYQDGFGTNKIQPFIIGVSSFLSIIPNCIENILNDKNIQVDIVKLIIMVYFFANILKMVKQKEYWKSSVIILFASFAFARGLDNMHAIAVWFIIISVIVLFSDIKKELLSNKLKTCLVLIFMIIIISNHAQKVNNILFELQKPISIVEQEIIEKTLDGEEIFCDADTCEMIYLIYKNRLPSNKLLFFLPWYMDWYEIETLKQLKENELEIVVFNEEKSKVFEEQFKAVDSYGELQRYINDNYEKSETSKILWYKKGSQLKSN